MDVCRTTRAIFKLLKISGCSFCQCTPCLCLPLSMHSLNYLLLILVLIQALEPEFILVSTQSVLNQATDSCYVQPGPQLPSHLQRLTTLWCASNILVIQTQVHEELAHSCHLTLEQSAVKTHDLLTFPWVRKIFWPNALLTPTVVVQTNKITYLLTFFSRIEVDYSNNVNIIMVNLKKWEHYKKSGWHNSSTAVCLK